MTRAPVTYVLLRDKADRLPPRAVLENCPAIQHYHPTEARLPLLDAGRIVGMLRSLEPGSRINRVVNGYHHTLVMRVPEGLRYYEPEHVWIQPKQEHPI